MSDLFVIFFSNIKNRENKKGQKGQKGQKKDHFLRKGFKKYCLIV